MNTENEQNEQNLSLNFATATAKCVANLTTRKVSTHQIVEVASYSSAQSAGAQVSLPQGGSELEIKSEVQERCVNKHSLSYILNNDETPALPNLRVSIEYESEILVAYSLPKNISQNRASFDRTLQFGCTKRNNADSS